MNNGYLGLPPAGASLRTIAALVNNILRGKLNAVTALTLAANVGSTTLTDPRLSANSFLGFMPLTANAAAELGNGTLYVSGRGEGTATIAHANNAQTDRQYAVLIIG